MSELQPYETTTNSSYVNFSRWQYTIPEYLLKEMMGFSPQKRHAFLLQSRFKIPLSFLYAVLLMYKTTGWYILLQLFIKSIWHSVTVEFKILTVIIILLFIALYASLKWAQTKNTLTIKEELKYFAIQNSISCTFAFLIVQGKFFITTLL